MAGDNVAVVLRAFENWNEGPAERVVAADWAPDVVVDWSRAIGPARGVYRGHAGLRRFRHDFFESFDEMTIEVIRADQVGGRVVLENVAHMHGREGISVQARSAFLIDVQADRISALTLFQTRQEALAAAGGGSRGASSDTPQP